MSARRIQLGGRVAAGRPASLAGATVRRYGSAPGALSAGRAPRPVGWR